MSGEEVGIDATLLAALCPVAASILKDKQTQLTIASFLPDAKLKFIVDEAAIEDLIAVKELLQLGVLLNKQEASFATAQKAVAILVALGVEKENFVVHETEENYRAKCRWAAMWGLHPAAELDDDLPDDLDYYADLNQDIQPPDLGFDLPMANTERASFEEENTQDFTEGGATLARWSGVQDGSSSSSMTLSEMLSLQIEGNRAPSTPDLTEEGSNIERGCNTSEEAGGGDPGVDEELSTIGNNIEENGNIARVTSRQDTSVESVIGNASNTSTIVLNNSSTSPETTPICGRSTTCDVINNNHSSSNSNNNNNNNNNSNSVLHHKTRQGMGNLNPPMDTDASPPISDQSSVDFINSTSESLVKKVSADVVKHISTSGLSSSNDEEDDVSEVTSSVSADSGFGSPKSGKRSADPDCNSPRSKKRRVSFSEVDQVQKFVGGKQGDSRDSFASSSDTWHGFVGDVSVVKAMKENLEVRSRYQNQSQEVVAEKEVVEEVEERILAVNTVKEVVAEKDVVEERVLAVNTMKEGAVFREVVEDVIQEEGTVEVGANKSVEEVDRIPLRSPKEAATVAVFPRVKRDAEVEKGPSCKTCVASKKSRLGRYSTDVGMAAHSRKHSRQVRLPEVFPFVPPHYPA